jgi:anti-anti-sigma regulatory factor
MLAIHVEKHSELVVIECKGRVSRDESVFALRDIVMEHDDAHTIALDLSEIEAIGGGGLGMLAFLQAWARENRISMKLFSPSKPVMEGLIQNRSIFNFEIASFHEMMSLLSHSDQHYDMAA